VGELTKRIISGLILMPIMIGILYLGGWIYATVIVIAAVLMAYEWQEITAKSERKLLWSLSGIGYITIPTISLLYLRSQHDGLFMTLWLFASVWSTDIGAYFAGKIIGGPKIAPTISPNKTWAGLIGGVACSAIISYLIAVYNDLHISGFVISGSVLALYAQLGDLLESWVKRHFGVKDSGKLIPGHGGILDRVDGLVPVAPKVTLLYIFFPHIFY